MQRSVVHLDAARAARRQQHWRDVARAACCQSGRNTVPAVDFCPSFAAALQAVPADQTRLLLLPTAACAIPVALPGRRAALVIGPEGGLDEAEVRQAELSGFTAAQLGPRILRAETAGIAALSALQALDGDLTGADR
jgi:16S rRNA (uracil1498-N3)-methyltransferase